MDISAQKNEKEKLFDELIDVKLLYKSQVKKWKKFLISEPGSEKVKEDLTVLKL